MSTSSFISNRSLAPPQVLRELRADGSLVLRSPQRLQPFARCIGDWLDHWSATTPEALFLAERAGDGQWRRVSYGEARTRVGRIAQGLLDLALPDGQPIAIVSDNAIEHALLTLAALHTGRPTCTVSSAYIRLTRDWSKVHAILDLLAPALVYAADAGVYGEALAQWQGPAHRVFGTGTASVPGASAFELLESRTEGTEVARRAAAIRPDQPAKYLLTQAHHRHLGVGGQRAAEGGHGHVALCGGCGRHRPRPRRDRPAAVPDAARARNRAGAGAGPRAAGAARPARRRRLLAVSGARPPARGRAGAGGRRDHRQGRHRPRAVLARRAADVAALYSSQPDPRVVAL